VGTLLSETIKLMNTRNLIDDLLATYEKHGWELKRVLLKSQSAKELAEAVESPFGEAEIRDSAIDALWFSRPSHNHGEAWELRLVAETPYALFERFDSEDSEEKRAEILKDLEARLLEYAVG